jgi:hypothetical protein
LVAALRTLQAMSVGAWGWTAIGLLVAAVVGEGCTSAPRRYRYAPPGSIGTEDRRVCHDRADRLAQQRYDRYMEIVELAGPFGGPFGGISLAERARQEREDFYEWEMKACLRERGYPLEAPGSSR